MRALLPCAAFAVAALLAGCGDNGRAAPRDDAGPPSDAPADAGPTRVTGCLDRAELPTAPSRTLPCDLIPPGLRP